VNIANRSIDIVLHKLEPQLWNAMVARTAVVSFGSDVLSGWGVGGTGIPAFLQTVMVSYVATRIVILESPGAWTPWGSKVTGIFANLRSG